MAQKQSLDKFEKKYWSEKLKTLRESEQVLRHAQEAHSKAQVDFQGFASMLKEKYGFDDKTFVDENGEIASTDVASES